MEENIWVGLIFILFIANILAFLKFWSLRIEKKTIISILFFSNVISIAIYFIKYRYL